MKLHLGCGRRNFGKDWIHADGGISTTLTIKWDFDHLDYKTSDLARLPFEDLALFMVA